MKEIYFTVLDCGFSQQLFGERISLNVSKLVTVEHMLNKTPYSKLLEPINYIVYMCNTFYTACAINN